MAQPACYLPENRRLEIISPTGVLGQLRIESDLAGGNGIEVIPVVPFTAATERTIHVVAGHCAGIRFDRSICNIGTKDSVGIPVGVEKLELMPTDEIPVADTIVEHKFAAAQTADFPDKAAYAHIVGRIVESLEICNGKTVDSCLIEVGAFPQRFHVSVEVGVTEIIAAKLGQFGLSLEKTYAYACTPEQRSAAVIMVDAVDIGERHIVVVEFPYAVTGRRNHTAGIGSGPRQIHISYVGISDCGKTTVANVQKILDAESGGAFGHTCIHR